MKISTKALFALATVSSISAAFPASATQLEFDCDVPADHFSSVSEDMAGGGSISGTIRADELRKGNNLPVVGAGIFGPENRAIASFQLVAKDYRTKRFDIVFNVYHEGGVTRNNVGDVDAESAISFSISLSNIGQAVLIVNGTQFKADAFPVPGGRGMAFCSTAQFKFTNLVFAASGDGSGG
jgi:hypothetical protein